MNTFNAGFAIGGVVVFVFVSYLLVRFVMKWREDKLLLRLQAERDFILERAYNNAIRTSEDKN